VTAEFTYPGPKPRSIETAVAMLADSVEAALRVIDDLTPAKIEQAIEKIAAPRSTPASSTTPPSPAADHRSETGIRARAVQHVPQPDRLSEASAASTAGFQAKAGA